MALGFSNVTAFHNSTLHTKTTKTTRFYGELENIDEARMELFCHGNRTMEKIPPTKAALLQHSKRAAYQAAVRTTSLLTKQDRPKKVGVKTCFHPDGKSN